MTGTGIYAHDARGRLVPFGQTPGGIKASQAQARRERESRERDLKESQRLATLTPSEIAAERKAKVMNELDRLAKETRHARQDAEDALSVYLNRLKRNEDVGGATDEDLSKKYQMDGQPRHLADRQTTPEPSGPIAFRSGK